MNLTDWMLNNLPGEVIEANRSEGLPEFVASQMESAFNFGAAMAVEVGEAAFDRNPYAPARIAPDQTRGGAA